MDRWSRTVFLLLALGSLGLNVYLIQKNESLNSRINEVKISDEQLTDIGEELYQMKENLRMPSKIVENLLPAIINFESKNKYLATGDGGKSHGAGQIQFGTAQDIMKSRALTVEDLYNPYVNPFLASEHLEYLYEKYKRIRSVVSAYNAGIPTEKNNKSYVDPILKNNGNR